MALLSSLLSSPAFLFLTLSPLYPSHRMNLFKRWAVLILGHPQYFLAFEGKCNWMVIRDVFFFSSVCGLWNIEVGAVNMFFFSPSFPPWWLWKKKKWGRDWNWMEIRARGLPWPSLAQDLNKWLRKSLQQVSPSNQSKLWKRRAGNQIPPKSTEQTWV